MREPRKNSMRSLGRIADDDRRPVPREDFIRIVLAGQTVPKTVGEEKAAEIAMDWMRVFYGIRVGTMESQEFRTRPVPHWLFCFLETIEGPIQRMYFVVLLPDGMVVEPKFAQRL
jgi:hypothetical protein